MGIKLSEKAAGEVKRIMQEQSYGPETLLRVGVNGGGCSGRREHGADCKLQFAIIPHLLLPNIF